MFSRGDKSIRIVSESRLYPIDALRGLAALIVAIYHFSATAPGDSFSLPEIFELWFPHMFFIHRLFYAGTEMVMLFFSISGFVFCHVYKERIRHQSISFEAYAVARISRLLPLVWLLIAITFIIRAIFFLLVNSPMPTLYDIFSGVQFMSMIVSGGGVTMLGPVWSLTPEIFAYILFFAMLRKWTHTRTETVIFSIAMVVVGLAIGTSFGTWGDWNYNYSIFNQTFIMVLPCFFGGVLTCMAWRWIKRQSRRLQLAATVPICIVSFYSLYAWLLHPDWVGPEEYVLPCVLFPSLFITVLSVKPFAKFLSLRFFVWLGDLSYTIYLMHWPIIFILNTLYACNSLPIERYSRLLFYLYILVIFLISHVLHHYYETPVKAIIRQKYAQMRESYPRI